jgi:hypothetical protein
MFPLTGGASCAFDTSFTITGADNPSIAIQQPYLYLTLGGADSLKIYNIVDPANPSLLSTTSLPASCGAYAIRIYYPYLYICYRTSNTVAIWDVTDPAAPTLTGSIVIGGAPPGGRAPWGVAKNGNYVAVAGASAIGQASTTIQGTKLDVTNPASPSIVDTWSYDGSSLYSAGWVETYGSHFYFTINITGAHRLVSVDVANFNTIDNVALSAPTGGGAARLCIGKSGTRAYVNSSAAGILDTVDISDPTNITLLNSLTAAASTASNTPLNPIAFREGTSTVYFGNFSGSSSVRVINATTDTPTNSTTISSGSDGQTDIVVVDDACLSLAFSVIGGSKVFLIGTPST